MIDSRIPPSEVKDLSVRGRVAFGLGVAEAVIAELHKDVDGFALARKALDTSWRWVAGEYVSGDEIAQYVDSPTENDLGIRELDYTEESMIGVLIATVLAIGLTARRAYEDQKAVSMPSPIWEIDDESLSDLMYHAKKSQLYDAGAVQRLAQYLSTAGDAIVSSDVLAHMRSPGAGRQG